MLALEKEAAEMVTTSHVFFDALRSRRADYAALAPEVQVLRRDANVYLEETIESQQEMVAKLKHAMQTLHASVEVWRDAHLGGTERGTRAARRALDGDMGDMVAHVALVDAEQVRAAAAFVRIDAEVAGSVASNVVAL